MPTLKPTDYNYTLQEVADEIGVSRERVRQIEHEALAKLKVAMTAKGIGPTDLDKDTPQYYLEEVPLLNGR